jgi:hypothetical protein
MIAVKVSGVNFFASVKLTTRGRWNSSRTFQTSPEKRPLVQYLQEPLRSNRSRVKVSVDLASRRLLLDETPHMAATRPEANYVTDSTLLKTLLMNYYSHYYSQANRHCVSQAITMLFEL